MARRGTYMKITKAPQRAETKPCEKSRREVSNLGRGCLGSLAGEGDICAEAFQLERPM